MTKQMKAREWISEMGRYSKLFEMAPKLIIDGQLIAEIQDDVPSGQVVWIKERMSLDQSKALANWILEVCD